MNQTLTIEYPQELPDVLNMSREDFEREAKLSLAVKLYETGKISSGKAAVIAGLDRVAFLLNLQKYDVSVFNYGLESLDDEIKNA